MTAIDDLYSNGFSIISGFIPPEALEEIRTFWISLWFKQRPRDRVLWSPYLGQNNHHGFSDDSFQYLYRACDFLWNDPIHPTTRWWCLEANRIRNKIIGRDENFATRFFDPVGIYASASYYPPDKGRMDAHVDGLIGKNGDLVHILIPITFLGIDYEDGGMVMTDRKGALVNIDSMVSPGDAVIYDGSLNHGVSTIKRKAGSGVGRLQIFPIPTVFTDMNQRAALARVPIKDFASAKWAAAKNTVRIKFGMNLSMR